MRKKFKVKQVGYGKDGWDSLTLLDLGFQARSGPGEYAYLGAIPTPGNSFFVYYDEPADGSDSGRFRLVRVEGHVLNDEIDIARGGASKTHVHDGLGTLTFYGEANGKSWSFHCEQPEVN